MSKHFIFSEDLFRKIFDKYSSQNVIDSHGNILCGENYFCGYNAKTELGVTTEFIVLKLRKNGPGEIKETKAKSKNNFELYFLLHTSDERELKNLSATHFQISSETQNQLWINAGGENPFIDKTQVVFFMHEPSCTAYSSFLRILKKCDLLVDFEREIQELFEFHNTKIRIEKRKDYLASLGYGDLGVQACMKKGPLNYEYIKTYYV